MGFLAVYLIGFFNLETEQSLAQWAKGMFKFLLHFGFLVVGIAYLARRSERFYWTAFAVFMAGFVANAVYGIVQLGTAEVLGINLDQSLLSPITGGASQINIYGAIEGASVFRPNALTGDPNHLGIELVIPLLVLTPLYLRLERGHRLKVPLALVLAFLLVVELATLSRSGLLGLAAGLLVLAIPYRHRVATPEFLLPLGGVAVVLGLVLAARWQFFEQVLRSRVDTSANGTSTHFDVYGFIPDVLSSHPLFGLGLNNFSVYYEFVTGRTNFGPHSFYVATLVETGLVGTALFAAFLVYLFRRLGRLRAIGRVARLAADPAAGVGDDRRARRHDRRERLLPDDVLLLLLRLRAPRARGADRVRPPPRREGRRPDDLVPARRAGRGRPLRPRRGRGRARAQGVDVEVVSPASFRHYGIAYGHGIAGNLRRRPWLVLLLPAFLLRVRAGGATGRARRRPRARALAARPALAALATGKPFVVQLWGTDVELARQAPWLFRPLLRRARLAIVASEYLADAARELGARDVRVVPSGVEIPEAVGEPDEPPHVLFVGRLSPEKGIHEFLAATAGLPRVIVGAGPVEVPEAVGFVPRSELGAYYERAAVVCVPSRREGYGVVAREAMAYGRPVVATAVGGLVDVTSVLVPRRGDVARLSSRSVEELLADAGWRAHLGAAGRERLAERVRPSKSAARAPGGTTSRMSGDDS